MRAISSALVILTLIVFGSVAQAGPKTKIAILGIEAVVGADGKINPADTKFAKALTGALRDRADSSNTFELIKESRELVDEKLMNNCGLEHPSCMGPIGKQMGAEALLFGKVENTPKGYKVTLKLVSVSKSQQIASDPNAALERADMSGAALGKWVNEHFRKLTGETSDGQLLVRIAGASGGRVLVDGSTKETLKSGQATLSLPEGKYKIGVEADGFKLFEQDVTISADKPFTLNPELTKADTGNTNTNGNNTTITGDPNNGVITRTGSTSGKKSKTIWKVAAAVGLGGAAVTGVLWGVQYFGPISDFKSTNLKDVEFRESVSAMPRTGSVGEGQCGNGKFYNKSDGLESKTVNGKFDDACSGYSKTKYLIPATGILALAGGAALVYVLMSSDGSEERATVGRQKKRRNLIVTPVVTPDGTGATLRFDW